MRNRYAVLLSSLVLLVTMALLAGCSKSDDDESYDESLLYGTWYCAEMDLYYEFSGTHEGRYHDAAGDGKDFSWSLDGDVLQLKVHGESVTVIVFETFVITSLNTSVMTCYDQQDPSARYTFKMQ